MTTTISPTEIISDAVAVRLAAHYGRTADGHLARLYWTGEVLRHAARDIERIYKHSEFTLLVDSRQKRDPQAITAELRALVVYLKHHAGRGAVEGWNGNQLWRDSYGLVVPWGYRGPELPHQA